MTNEEQKAENENSETFDTAIATEKSDEEIVCEAIEAANAHPNVSGIGTERGFLESLLERCRAGEALIQEQLEHARLVKSRADEVTSNYLT